MYDFNKLNVYKKSYKFGLDIYLISKNFPKDERFGLTSQIRRAATSISLNLAEGSSRTSIKDKCRFIQISLGSVNECLVLISYLKDLNHIDLTIYENLDNSLIEIKKMLISLYKKIKFDD
jgi:four helix bundle protein